MIYRTKEGEVLDQLCLKHYGRRDLVPLVLEDNPGLADYGTTLPAGVLIYFPPIDDEPENETTRLWD